MKRLACKKRLLNLRISMCVVQILCLITMKRLLNCPWYNYSHVPRENLSHHVYHAAVQIEQNTSKLDCTYGHILQSDMTIPNWSKFDDFSLKNVTNGSYMPGCNPLFSVAILVPYRNRLNNLNIFLPYTHNFLMKQNIHYKIFVIEQQDGKPFNRGLLFNVGAKYAIAEKFPCLILHDVDLLPLDEGNLYVCMNEPRHMSACINKFRFVLPYKELVGGVLAIRSDQFLKVNGFSNKFEGWGGEDTDFAYRLQAQNLNVLRFPPDKSRYIMLKHRPAKKNSERFQIISENMRSSLKEGYNSVVNESIQVKTKRDCTIIGVKLR